MMYAFVHWFYQSTLGHPDDLLDLTHNTTFLIQHTLHLVESLDLLPVQTNVEDVSFYKCTNRSDRVEMCPNCDHKEDPITYETIATDNGACMNGLCYDIQTIQTLQTKTDPFTRRPMTWEEQRYVEDRVSERSLHLTLLSSGYIGDFFRKARNGTLSPTQAFLLLVTIFDSTYRSDRGNLWRLCTASVLIRAITYLTKRTVLSAATRFGSPSEQSVTQTLRWAYLNRVIPQSDYLRLMTEAALAIYYKDEELLEDIATELEEHALVLPSTPSYSSVREGDRCPRSTSYPVPNI
jgi:hypothetical protein